MIRRLLAISPRIVPDQRGTALIEFAILLPILVSLYLGTYQLIEGSSCKRRVTITARAVADLTSQYASLTSSQLDDIMDASTQIMAPYDITPSTIRVSQIVIDNNRIATVTWSQGQNIAQRPVGQLVQLPTGLHLANSCYVYAEVTYTYTPLIAWVTGAMTFTQTQFMLPRRSATITLQSGA